MPALIPSGLLRRSLPASFSARPIFLFPTCMTRRQFLIACLLGTSLFVFLPLASAQPRVSASPLEAQADTFALENGLRVTLLPYASESVGVSLELRAGHAYTSSSPRASSALARALAAASPSLPLDPTSDADGIRLTGEVSPDHVDSLLASLAHAAQHPVVNADVLASSPSAPSIRPRAVSAFQRVLFGSHPYASSDSTAAPVSADDVLALHDTYVGAQNAHLFVAGGFRADDVAARIRSAFGTWTPGTDASLPPVPDAPSPPEFSLVNVASSSDAAVVAGRRIVSPQHPDYLALRVADALLGGAYASRVPSGLRRTLGHPVSAKSQIVSHTGASYWMQTAVAPAGAADSVLQTIFDALRDLRAGVPPASDVRAAQDFVARSVAMQDATPSGVAEHLADLSRHGLGPDALKGRIDAIYAVTPDDVHRVAVRYLAPDALHVTAAGNRNVLGDRLFPFFSTSP